MPCPDLRFAEKSILYTFLIRSSLIGWFGTVVHAIIIIPCRTDYESTARFRNNLLKLFHHLIDVFPLFRRRHNASLTFRIKGRIFRSLRNSFIHSPTDGFCVISVIRGICKCAGRCPYRHSSGCYSAYDNRNRKTLFFFCIYLSFLSQIPFISLN